MGLLSDLRLRVAEILEGSEELGASPAVPVLTEDRGDLQQLIPQHLSRAGAAVVVLTPGMTPQANGNAVADIKVICVENAVQNRGSNGTQKHASDMAEWVAAELMGQSESAIEPWSNLTFVGISIEPGDIALTYIVDFTAACRLSAEAD